MDANQQGMRPVAQIAHQYGALTHDGDDAFDNGCASGATQDDNAQREGRTRSVAKAELTYLPEPRHGHPIAQVPKAAGRTLAG